MENRNKVTLDDVFNTFVAENDRPTAENLQEWVKRYPQYRRELVDFAAAWAEQLVLPPAPELGPEAEKALIDRAMSYVLNVAYDRNVQKQQRDEDDDLVHSLTGEAQRVGMSAQDLAQACDLDLVLISKLNSRLINPETIPTRLVSSLGKTATEIDRSDQGIFCKAATSRGGQSFSCAQETEKCRTTKLFRCCAGVVSIRDGKSALAQQRHRRIGLIHGKL